LEYGGEFDTWLEGTRNDAEQVNLFGAPASQHTDLEHFLDSDLVGGKLDRNALEQEILLRITDARAGSAGSYDSIDNVNAVSFLQFVANHKPQGAGIEQFHVGREGVVALQVADEMDAESFVREEQVARAED
jgi:hypothetical protein